MAGEVGAVVDAETICEDNVFEAVDFANIFVLSK